VSTWSTTTNVMRYDGHQLHNPNNAFTTDNMTQARNLPIREQPAMLADIRRAGRRELAQYKPCHCCRPTNNTVNPANVRPWPTIESPS